MTKEQVAEVLAQAYTVDGDYYTRGRVKVHLLGDCMTIKQCGKQGGRLDIVYYDEDDITRAMELLVG